MKNCKMTFLKVYSKYESTYENKVPIITVEDIYSCIRKMKMSKAAGVDGLTTEHLLYCHPLITVQLSLIFTSIVNLDMYHLILVSALLYHLLRMSMGMLHVKTTIEELR